jgi:hypothetical protein
MARDIPVIYHTIIAPQDQPNTVEFTWAVENTHSVTLQVFSDIFIGGEHVETFTTDMAPGDTKEYRSVTYTDVTAGDNVECCVEATGADTGITVTDDQYDGPVVER